MSELMQFEIGISTSLYFPPKLTAGLERFSVRGKSLVPFPPPRMSTITFFCILAVICIRNLTYPLVLLSSINAPKKAKKKEL